MSLLTVALLSVSTTLLLHRAMPCPASLPIDRQRYAKANLTKAVLLAAYTPWALRVLWDGVVHDAWSNQVIHRLSILYATPDAVSLFLVRRMSRTTTAHHLFVLAFVIVSLNNDYSRDNACRSIVVYACFSTFSYAVNALLGMRFVATTIPAACFDGAAFVYAACMGLNWTFQLTYMASRLTRWTLVHGSAISIIMVDDIVLLRWLLTRSAMTRRTLQRMADPDKYINWKFFG